ncbi:MAG: hypothetical protein WCR27_02730 [Eubacteriales bacterium]
MSIASVSFSSNSAYTNQSMSSARAEILEQMKTKGTEEGSRPAGGGPPAGGPPPSGPDLDTDGDGSWSESEIEDYASYSQEVLGISLDSEEILSKYDSDEDGTISSDERVDLAKDNALQLPKPPQMVENSESNLESNFSTMDAEDTRASLINQLLNAYSSSSNYSNESLLTTFEAAI